MFFKNQERKTIKMRRVNIRDLLLLVIVFLYTPKLCAQTYGAYARETLRGLKGVYVFIMKPPNIVTQAGLTESILRTNAELKLRTAGISVLTIEEIFSGWPGVPYLYVQISAIELEQLRGFFVYLVSVKFKQNVMLSRNRSIEAKAATTWERGFYGIDDDVRSIRETVSNLIDEFMNDYLAVNPK
jgi:hypothetical protein